MINKQGRERYCEPDLEKLNEIAQWIEPFKKMWETRFEEGTKMCHRNLDEVLEEILV